MDYVAHEGRLDAKMPDGKSSYRANLNVLARKGGTRAEEAIAELTARPLPDEMRYILNWHNELFGRCGVGMDGYDPLTWTSLHAWAEMTGRDPEPYEVDLLMNLDAIRRHPPKEEKPEADKTPSVRRTRIWRAPVRKGVS